MENDYRKRIFEEIEETAKDTLEGLQELRQARKEEGKRVKAARDYEAHK